MLSYITMFCVLSKSLVRGLTAQPGRAKYDAIGHHLRGTPSAASCPAGTGAPAQKRR